MTDNIHLHIVHRTVTSQFYTYMRNIMLLQLLVLYEMLQETGKMFQKHFSATLPFNDVRPILYARLYLDQTQLFFVGRLKQYISITSIAFLSNSKVV